MTDPKWVAIDLETTGLDPYDDADEICEMGLAVLNPMTLEIESHFNDVCGGDNQFHLLGHSKRDYVSKMHEKSGLMSELAFNETTMAQLEIDAMDWLSGQDVKSKEAILLGSSLHLDRSFLEAHMPGLSRYFGYRMIDVSSIKELCRRWSPVVYANLPAKEEDKAHRVIQDIAATLDELLYYRKHGFGWSY